MRSPSTADIVPETRFGKWFLGTQTWSTYVVQLAVDELCRLAAGRHIERPRILDVGCGFGAAFPMLERRFLPTAIVGVDADDHALDTARRVARGCTCPVAVVSGDVTALDLDDSAFDIVFCHQTLHHVRRQDTTLAEFYRVLKPGGVLLLAESCRSFINSALVRLLFRHPMEVQRTAPEYLALLRSAGFTFGDADFSTTAPWWSQPDLGLIERARPSTPPRKRATQLCVVASPSKLNSLEEVHP